MYADGGKQIMVTGHLEYEAQTLAEEYLRDLEKGLGYLKFLLIISLTMTLKSNH